MIPLSKPDCQRPTCRPVPLDGGPGVLPAPRVFQLVAPFPWTAGPRAEAQPAIRARRGAMRLFSVSGGTLRLSVARIAHPRRGPSSAAALPANTKTLPPWQSTIE